MLSPHHKKTVFIDFGLSKFIEEKIGFKSMTHFVGTLNFCCNEMTRCFLEDIALPVDLYYNDLISLENTIARKKQKIIPGFIKET